MIFDIICLIMVLVLVALVVVGYRVFSPITEALEELELEQNKNKRK
jgi:Tfp pilus assembly protein PilO